MKKRAERKIDEFSKKLMISESEILQCEEHIVKSKVQKIFANEKILEEYCVKGFKINPYFYKHFKKKKKKLIKMDLNTYYLDFMFIFLDII